MTCVRDTRKGRPALPRCCELQQSPNFEPEYVTDIPMSSVADLYIVHSVAITTGRTDAS